jgi:hypothetical protein
MPDKNPFMATEVVAQAASPGKPKKLLENASVPLSGNGLDSSLPV